MGCIRLWRKKGSIPGFVLSDLTVKKMICEFGVVFKMKKE